MKKQEIQIEMQKTYAELEKEYHRLAKRADQRLVRLEGYRHDKGYESITSYAYATAQKAIKEWSGDKATRFNTKAPKSKKDLIAKISDINRFLQAPTSTKKGTIDLYKSRAETTNKHFFGNDRSKYLTWQEWQNFWDITGADMVDKIPYAQAAAGAGIMKKHKIKTKDPDDIKRTADKLVRTDKIDVVEQSIIESLAENGLTLDKLVRK